MDIVVYRSGTAHATPVEAAVIEGFKRHGMKPDVRQKGDFRVSDVAVIWGHRDEGLHRMQLESGSHYLVLERGHVGDRRAASSMGWDGLGRHGRYPTCNDDGARWRRLYGDLMAPWNHFGECVTVFGQVAGDASIKGIDFCQWAQHAVDMALKTFDKPVLYRPHPLSVRNGANWCPDGASLSVISLEEDLARASVAITFNSTSGVNAVLAGVPTICADKGAMAWPVSSHNIVRNVETPGREQWAHDLAWCQWTNDEIADGIAWDAVRTVMEI